MQASIFQISYKKWSDWVKNVANEPERDDAGFVSATGRREILDSEKFNGIRPSAVVWNSDSVAKGNYAGFMKEICSDSGAVLRLVPVDPMLRPLCRYEFGALASALVWISQALNQPQLSTN